MLGVGLVALVGASSGVGREDREPAIVDELNEQLRSDVAGVLERSCVQCHGPETSWSDVRLDGLSSLDDAERIRHDLHTSRQRILAGEMPPPGEGELAPADRALVLDWLRRFEQADPARNREQVDPGWYTLRRLNTDEYRATMRDLLGVDPGVHDLARGLPADDLAYGFDTVGDVLTVSTLHLEAYLEAAERALDLALGQPVDRSGTPRRLELATGRGGRLTDSGSVVLFSNGAAIADAQIPVAGDYEIRVLARGQRAGDELPRIEVAANGTSLTGGFVEAERDDEPQEFRSSAVLESGSITITAAFTNDFYIKGKADRNAFVDAIEISGPLHISPESRTEGYRRVVVTEPGDAGTTPREAAASVLRSFASRAYRRPAEGAELEALLGLYDRAAYEGEPHERALRTALTGCLVSPSFLYRAVTNPYPDDPAYIHRLNSHELASRLSYFLWSSMPDAELRRLADLGLLEDDDVLRSQVRRMVADDRAGLFVERFAGQWLLLRQLEQHEIDATTFAEFDDDLRSAMIDEATRTFAEAVRQNLGVGALINSRSVFVNERLAEHYGIDGVRGPTIRRVELEDHSVRGGILTSGAVLTLTSNPARTSPVKRGLYVLDQILGTPPPPPPVDIAPLEQVRAKLGPNPTLREQLDAHLLDQSCASCHASLDPIGLAMENFDALGRWRDSYEGSPIDALGTLPTGESFDGVAGLKRLLATREPQIRRNLAERLLTYAVGRGLERFDRPGVEQILASAGGERAGMVDLIEAIVLSDTFRSCRARGTQP